MPEGTTASGNKPKESTGFDSPTEEKLPKWVLVSLVLHSALIVLLFVAPYWPSDTPEPPPAYVVDLVGGEKIGGRNLGTRVEPLAKASPLPPAPPPDKSVSLPKPAPPPPPARIKKPEPVKKAERKPEKIPPVEEKKPEKAVPIEKKKAPPEKAEKNKSKPSEEVSLAKNEVPDKREERDAQKSAPAKKEPIREAKTAAESNEERLERVRERLIESAVERLRSRSATGQRPTGTVSSDKGEALSAGTGEGQGAQSLGKGGVGGDGDLKSIEYIRYFNHMEAALKANWAWAGPKRDLKALVRFGIKETGEIVGVKIVQTSGDPLYDESVIRAVRKSSPLPAPPESYRKEFSDVQFYFQPDKTG